MTDPMPDRCPAIEPGFGVLERCVFHVGHGGYHLAGGAWPIEETTRRCTAAGAVTGGRCVLPGGHDEDDGTVHLFAGPGGSAQAVEWSTPIAAPARPCGMHYSWPSQAGSEARTLGPCVLDVADHHERHRDEHGNEWLNVQWALNRLDAAPAGEVVSAPPPADSACCVDSEQGPDAHGTLLHTLGCVNRCGVDTTWYPPSSPLQGSPYPCGTTLGHEGDHWAPPALRTPMVADDPVPVPPPVDALLKLIGVYGQARFAVGAGEERDSEGQATKWRGRASEAHETITNEVNALWAAGVAEGRRLAEDEFDNRSTYELAGLVHRYLHVEAPDNSDPVQVAIEVLEEAIQDHDTAGALETRGVAEGRRQATEERTEVERG